VGVKKRFALTVVLIAAVFGGLIPHVMASAEGPISTLVAPIVQEPPSEPVSCIDAVCDKGSPTPAAPTTAVALAAFLAGVVIAAAFVSSLRRRRNRVTALPRGARDPLFHPPQFS
jgi:hypothetical protein